MILIVASSKDMASLNIKEQILNHYDFEKTRKDFHDSPTYTIEIDNKEIKLATLNIGSVYAQTITDSFPESELTVFISRHSSVSGTPTLSVHTPGNLGEAKAGGIARKVSVSPANAMRTALNSMMQLKEEMEVDFEVSYECTHHGPSLQIPTMFVELGSSPTQWNDMKAAEIVAHATIKAVSKFGSFPSKSVIGIGGPHYNRKFTRIALENNVSFGHIIPKYAIPNVDSEILEQCIEKTLEEVESAVLDWKGIRGEDKPKLTEMLKKAGIPFKRAKHLT